MPRLFRQTYTKPIPPGAQPCTLKGKPAVRFTGDDGKPVTALLSARGDRVRLKSAKWYGEYTDAEGITRRVPLSADKTAAGQMLAALVRRAELGRAGLADPFEEHRKRPLTAHLEDYRRFLEAKGNTAKHARQTCRRAAALLTGCKAVFQADLSPSAVLDWLAAERAAGRLTIQTSNYYLRDLKSFCRWLVKDRRAADNPLAHLSGQNAAVERHRERRPLEPGDFAAFLEAARQGQPIRRLSGFDRAMLYTVAAFTGLRASELVSLTPASFALDAEPPTVTVEAAYSKRRRRDSILLRPDLAALVRDWLAGRPADRQLWPGLWWKHAAKMVRADLEAASIPYRDAAGRVFDFHALRHQFISNLAAGGVHPKVAQALARHSTIGLTMDRYTHLGLHDEAAALDKLPKLPEAPTAAASGAALAATGTEGAADFSASGKLLPGRSSLPSSLPAAYRTGEVSCPSVRAAEATAGRPDARAGSPQVLKLQGPEKGCEDLRAAEGEEAPPGFEPGMADLQSAALPLG
jgi:integrase